MRDIKNCIKELPWGPGAWSKRALKAIDRIVVHQALADMTIAQINNYHISPGNHISEGGCPHICYHYCIGNDGTIYKTNPLSSTVWHCRKQNSVSIGILVVGNFGGPSHVSMRIPTNDQIDSLQQLLDYFTHSHIANLWSHKLITIQRENVFGHSYFGKENCPGYVIDEFIRSYKA